MTQDVLSGALGDLSLTSDPLTQNRYALAGGNPVSFVEWDGHLPVQADGTRIVSSGPGSSHDSWTTGERSRPDGAQTTEGGHTRSRRAPPELSYTLEEIQQMSGEERLEWLQQIDERYRLEGWLNAIAGVIKALDQAGLLERGSWSSWLDAGILQGIQNGLALSRGYAPVQGNTGAGDWKAFFVRQRSGAPDTELIPRWGRAEDRTTEAAARIADAKATRREIEERVYAGGEFYRSQAQDPVVHEPLATLLEASGRVPGPVADILRGKVDPRNEAQTYLGTRLIIQYGSLVP